MIGTGNSLLVKPTQSRQKPGICDDLSWLLTECHLLKQSENLQPLCQCSGNSKVNILVWLDSISKLQIRTVGSARTLHLKISAAIASLLIPAAQSWLATTKLGNPLSNDGITFSIEKECQQLVLDLRGLHGIDFDLRQWLLDERLFLGSFYFLTLLSA